MWHKGGRPIFCQNFTNTYQQRRQMPIKLMRLSNTSCQMPGSTSATKGSRLSSALGNAHHSNTSIATCIKFSTEELYNNLNVFMFFDFKGMPFDTPRLKIK